MRKSAARPPPALPPHVHRLPDEGKRGPPALSTNPAPPPSTHTTDGWKRARASLLPLTRRLPGRRECGAASSYRAPLPDGGSGVRRPPATLATPPPASHPETHLLPSQCHGVKVSHPRLPPTLSPHTHHPPLHPTPPSHPSLHPSFPSPTFTQSPPTHPTHSSPPHPLSRPPPPPTHSSSPPTHRHPPPTPSHSPQSPTHPHLVTHPPTHLVTNPLRSTPHPLTYSTHPPSLIPPHTHQSPHTPPPTHTHPHPPTPVPPQSLSPSPTSPITHSLSHPSLSSTPTHSPRHASTPLPRSPTHSPPLQSVSHPVTHPFTINQCQDAPSSQFSLYFPPIFSHPPPFFLPSLPTPIL
ncbi:hypothetical protein FKM82_022918 [Ascaphus truei]